MFDHCPALQRLNDAFQGNYDKPGANEAWLDSILFYLSNAYGKNPEVLKGYEEEKRASITTSTWPDSRSFPV